MHFKKIRKAIGTIAMLILFVSSGISQQLDTILLEDLKGRYVMDRIFVTKTAMLNIDQIIRTKGELIEPLLIGQELNFDFGLVRRKFSDFINMNFPFGEGQFDEFHFLGFDIYGYRASFKKGGVHNGNAQEIIEWSSRPEIVHIILFVDHYFRERDGLMKKTQASIKQDFTNTIESYFTPVAADELGQLWTKTSAIEAVWSMDATIRSPESDGLDAALGNLAMKNTNAVLELKDDNLPAYLGFTRKMHNANLIGNNVKSDYMTFNDGPAGLSISYDIPSNYDCQTSARQLQQKGVMYAPGGTNGINWKIERVIEIQGQIISEGDYEVFIEPQRRNQYKIFLYKKRTPNSPVALVQSFEVRGQGVDCTHTLGFNYEKSMAMAVGGDLGTLMMNFGRVSLPIEVKAFEEWK